MHYYKTDVSEDIDINKSKNSNNPEFVIIATFFKVSFIYQPLVCNNCNDIMQRSTSFNNAAIVNEKNDYRFIFGVCKTKNEEDEKCRFEWKKKQKNILKKKTLHLSPFYNNE